MLLEKIQYPADVKALSLAELNSLVEEARQALITKVATTGGHFGPPMGAADMMVALHYVFSTPYDKIVFDVSHQSYVHKMLTGRAEAFLSAEHYQDISGFTNPKESEHDCFNVGHTSTSVSLATGLAKGRDILGESYNVVALIGDGSLSGGEAFEGLNYAATLSSNLIIIVNDNEQSIAENHGGLYGNLSLLRQTKGQAHTNFFKAMGFEYHYIEEGNDIEALVEAFQNVKDSDHPVLLHVHTQKGKGYAPAEVKEHLEAWHWTGPFDLNTGIPTYRDVNTSYAGIAASYLLELIEKGEPIYGITAGTPSGFYTPEWRKRAGNHYIDVGVAEEHAIAMISGMAKAGAKPVFSIYSSFLQRTYDQLVQDLCVNENPAVILNHMASVDGTKDVTHLGYFDIPMVSHIPNLVYLAPTNKEELLAMMDWAIHQNEHPVMIRVPVGNVKETGITDTTDYSHINTYQLVQKGKDVAILGLGNFFNAAQDIVSDLAKDGITATLVNPKFITGIDAEMLHSLEEDHSLIVTYEDGIVDGGFGLRIASFYGMSTMKVKNYGLRKAFHDRYQASQVLQEDGACKEQILADIKAFCSQK